VPPPHAVDLAWVACTDCGHGWQPHFDAGLLERIYREHYYTPAPDGIAVQFRDDFLAVVRDFGLMGERQSVVEIGASAGDALATIRDRTHATHALAFEPDSANAVRARQRGLEVTEQFFGLATAQRPGPRADLVYARHVIEHVFDFTDFLAGVDAIAAPKADLVLETPALDHHVATAALNPFHIEHVHVFSSSSLARLGLAHGWRLRHSRITVDGNLIASFGRRDEFSEGDAPPVPKPPLLAGLQERFAIHRSQMRRRLDTRCLVFWGAGSASVRLASLIGRAPDIWTDGNPSKVGKKFVGHEVPIVAPERALAEAASRHNENPVVVIASSFVREILPRVRALGWDGDVLDLEGSRL
jgi:hypothetical protein